MIPITQINQILKIVAPEFASKDDAFLNTWINIVASEVREQLFGNTDNIDYQKAVAYLTAAKMKISSTNGQGASGALVRKKTGDVELEYGRVAGAANSSILDNAYMMEYKRLLSLYTRNTIILEI
jgi:hypothetical protein